MFQVRIVIGVGGLPICPSREHNGITFCNLSLRAPVPSDVDEAR